MKLPETPLLDCEIGEATKIADARCLPKPASAMPQAASPLGTHNTKRRQAT
ncbi:hypothetical protein [Cupriavidus sp. AcVe19-6a]|uniref:hypothetical protein n=1 Tax=Cupriavidus sp. AcVe19-6a TaxID=2821358 RepID=UPI001AE14BAD|nr:hypothetical protein [Cupriavidus sp. AcVe19-6a]MBP0637467.1 hypothetical protein [Cupriavidus sp. AcVe19-6a]